MSSDELSGPVFRSRASQYVALGVCLAVIGSWLLIRRAEGFAADRALAAASARQERDEKSAACRRGYDCTESGACGADATGACVAVSAADCAASNLCPSHGLCGLRGEVCAPTEDAHCLASVHCKSGGRCSAGGSKCMATEASCAERADCVRSGQCHVDAAGDCVAKRDADCNTNYDCYYYGACSARGGRCVAAKDEDCLGSLRCRERHHCRADGGHCIADAATCAESAACTRLGQCAGEHNCSADHDEMCARGSACKDKACRAFGEGPYRECAVSCAETTGCKMHGRCGEEEQDGNVRCVAASDADCKQSAACRGFGHGCFRSSSGRCVDTERDRSR